MNAYMEKVDEYLAKSGVVQNKLNIVSNSESALSEYVRLTLFHSYSPLRPTRRIEPNFAKNV